jgi:hypothetical protein
VVLLTACTTAATCRSLPFLALVNTHSADSSPVRHIPSVPAQFTQSSSSSGHGTLPDSGVGHFAHSRSASRGAQPPFKRYITRLHSSSSSRREASQYTSRRLLLLRGLKDRDRSPQTWLHKRQLQQADDDTYGASTAARVIRAPPMPSHTVVHSFTPETAEAIAYSDSRWVRGCLSALLACIRLPVSMNLLQ